MLVRRIKSNKRHKNLYEAVYFCYDDLIFPVSDFIGKYGRLIKGEREHTFLIKAGTIIEMKDGRIITPNQVLIKNGYKKIINLDISIFHEYFTVFI